MTLVVNGRIVGFSWEPGRNAGYRAGRSLRWGGCCHQTAGRCAGDRSVLTKLGGAYVPRDPACGPGATQFAELDAVAFTQCEWNDELMPCEVEWVLGQTFNDYQIDKCGLFVAACIEVGVPDVRLDPPSRVLIGTRIGGFIDHRKLQHKACDQHADGWYAHWPAIRAAATKYLGGVAVPIIGQGDDNMRVVIDENLDGFLVEDDYIVEPLGRANQFGVFLALDGVTPSPRPNMLAKIHGITRLLNTERETLKPKPVVAPGAPASGVTKAELQTELAAALGPFRTLLPGV